MKVNLICFCGCET